ncbi:MAG: tetratricopeptide repeat protein [Bacteroidia bacterium]|nr:tetratricopeptide repeat protein [Bacteroidia bacterium]
MNCTRVFRRMPVYFFALALATGATGQPAGTTQLITEAARVRKEDPVKAFSLYTQAFEQAAESNSSDLAKAASEAVTLGFMQGGELLSKASALLLKALPVIDNVGDTSLDAAMIYYTAGYYYFSYYPLKWEEALKYFNKSLAIRTQRLGEQSSEVALCYSRLGDVYKYLLSDYAAAEDCYEKSIHIHERINGLSQRDGSADKLFGRQLPGFHHRE